MNDDDGKPYNWFQLWKDRKQTELRINVWLKSNINQVNPENVYLSLSAFIVHTSKTVQNVWTIIMAECSWYAYYSHWINWIRFHERNDVNFDAVTFPRTLKPNYHSTDISAFRMFHFRTTRTDNNSSVYEPGEYQIIIEKIMKTMLFLTHFYIHPREMH